MDTKNNKIKNDLSGRYNSLISDCCEAITKCLVLINKVFSDDDDEPLQFFEFASTSAESIIKIYPDSNCKIGSGRKESLIEMIKLSKIPLDNAISLAEELIALSATSPNK